MGHLVGDWSSAAVLVAVLIYTAVYFARSPWRSSLLTMIFAGKNLLVVLYMAQVQASLWWGTDYPWRWILRPFANSWCAVAYLALAVLLWHLQSQERDVLQAEVNRLRSDESDAYAENERDHS